MSEAYRSLQPCSTLYNTGFEVDPALNRIQVSISQRGLDIHVPHPRHLFRGMRRSFWKTTDKVSAMLYPVPLGAVLALGIGLCVFSWRAPPTSFVHTNPVTKTLLFIDMSLNPFYKLTPPAYREPAMWAKVWAATLGAATVLHRFLLRRLLRLQQWKCEADPDKPSWRTRLWSMVLKLGLVHNRIQCMEVYEHCLPNLPLPSLSATVAKYLASVRPVLQQQSDPTDWIDIRRAAESFLLNEGPTLQRHLRLHYVVSPNYVSDWFTRNVFLSSRESLCLHSNFYIVPYASYKPTSSPAARAAVLVYYLARLKEKIQSGTLSPDFTGPRNCVPLSMTQYLLAFNTTRIPGRECDLIEHDGKTDADYIVVLISGRIYQVPLYQNRSRWPLTPLMLHKLFESLIADAADEEISTGRDSSEEESDGEGADDASSKRRSYRIAESLIPTLTTAPRATWADARSDYLLNDASNNRPLRVIEKALFVVSLEDGGRGGSSETISTNCASYLCGNGSNLWCDKSFNLVIRADGQAGVHVEHSWCDMATFLAFFEHVTAAEEKNDAYDEDGLPRHLPGDRRVLSPEQWDELQPRRVRFKIHKSLANIIRATHTEFLTDVASQTDLQVRRFGTYGAALPRHYGCTPSAWMQMAIQLAYYLDQHHTLSQVYESVPMRMYLKGRTEALRGVSEASHHFVRAATARNAMGELTEECSSAEKRELLLKACRVHEKARQEATCGEGIDRHLFALYMVSAGKQIPSDFITAVLRRTRWHISVAEAPQRSQPRLHPTADPEKYETPCCGFGPVSTDGYGISYSFVGDHALYFTVTSLKGCESTSAATLADRIEGALQTIADLMTEVDDA